MTTINRITGNVFAISALALAVNSSLYADTDPVLTLGETINVTAAGDATPSCMYTGGTGGVRGFTFCNRVCKRQC